jgi:tetratricopeptide (TPR) repeat protein
MNNPDTSAGDKLKKLESYLAVDPHNVALLVDVATLQYQQGQFDAARSRAEQILQLNPQQATAHALTGLVAALSGEIDLAVTHLQQAIELGDGAPLLQYQLADVLIRSGHYSEAVVHAKLAAEQASQLPFAPALYIRALHYLGELDGAIAYGNDVEASGQPAQCSAAFYGALASVYLDADDLVNAKRAASLALQQDPHDVDGNTTLGMLALADGETDQALAALQGVVEQRPNNGRAWLGIGLAQFVGGAMDEAAASLQKAVHHLHHHLGTLNALAWVYILKKDAINAETTLLSALERDRTFAETHGTLAIVALMKGNLDSAVQAVKRANGLDRNNFAGNFANSLIQQVSGNPTQARAIMEKLLLSPVLPGETTLQEAIAKAFAKFN